MLESRENPVIVTGHTRVEACKSLGWKEIPDENIAYCDGLTEDEIKLREQAGERIKQIGFEYRNKGSETRHEIEKLEEKRKQVFANTAAGIRAQAAERQARREFAFDNLVKERTRLQAEAAQWRNSRAFRREQQERRRKADIEIGRARTSKEKEVRKVIDKLGNQYREIVDNRIKELNKVIAGGSSVNNKLLDEYLS